MLPFLAFTWLAGFGSARQLIPTAAPDDPGAQLLKEIVSSASPSPARDKTLGQRAQAAVRNYQAAERDLAKATKKRLELGD